MGLFLGLLGGILYGVMYMWVLREPLLFMLAFAGLGFMIGESVGIATNRKRGVRLQYVAGGGVVIAYLTFSALVGVTVFTALIGAVVGVILAIRSLR